MALLGALGCSAPTPKRAVQEFISARIAGNDARAAKLTVEGDLSGFSGGEAAIKEMGGSFRVVASQVEENRALVSVLFKWDDMETEIPYVCRRGESQWKVALRETEDMWLGETD